MTTLLRPKRRPNPVGQRRTKTRLQAMLGLLTVALTLFALVAPASARHRHRPPPPPPVEEPAPEDEGSDLPIFTTDDPVQMEATIVNGVATLDFTWDPIPGGGDYYIIKAGFVVASVSETSYSRTSNWWFNLSGPYSICASSCWSFTVEPPPGKTVWDFV